MENKVYLYKLKNCLACESARDLLISKGYNNIQEYYIDHPLLQLGNQVLFKDGLVHAPLIWISNQGVYILDANKTNLIRILQLKNEKSQCD